MIITHYFPLRNIKTSSVPNYHLWLAAGWTVIITILSLTTSAAIPGIKIEGADKLVHVVMYFFFTIFWYLYFRGQLSELEISRVLLFVFLVSGMYGVIIELSQAFFTQTREADINDVFANLAGSFAAVCLFLIQSKYLQSRTDSK